MISDTVTWLVPLLLFDHAISKPTGELISDEDSKDEEGIVEGWANVLWAMGLVSDGGVDASCPSSDICSHEII